MQNMLSVDTCVPIDKIETNVAHLHTYKLDYEHI